MTSSSASRDNPPRAWRDTPSKAGRANPIACIAQARFDPLAFVQLWAAWRADPQRPPLLHVVANCQAPFDGASLANARVAWPDALQPLAQTLIQQCWGLLPGVHRLRFEHGQLCLTLHIAESENTAHDAAVANTTLGYPPDALGEGQPTAIVIGAGMAGAGTAHALALRGWHVQVLDRGDQPAAGASGLPVGLVAPHTSPDDSIISRLSRAGVRAMHHVMQDLLREGTDWRASGVQERRLPGKTRKGGAPQHWSQAWAPFAHPWTRAAEPPAPPQALWHEKGAWLKPTALVHALLQHPRIRWQGDANIHSIRHVKGQWQALQDDTVVAQAHRLVVATGPTAPELISPIAGLRLPLQALRGQVSWGLQNVGQSPSLPATPVNGHGSFVPHVPTPEGPAWFAGSTFDRQHDQPHLSDADHAENFARLQALLPDTAHSLQQVFNSGVRGWAGVRASVPDRLPMVGPIANAPPGLWVNAGMGARGLTLAILCGEVLAARWHNEPLPIEPPLAKALDALRYQ